MINVLVADDHALVRSGLCHIISTWDDFIVVGEAANGAGVIDQLRRHSVDLLLLDMSMPGLSGLGLIERLRIEWPSLRILVLSMHNDPQIVSRALNAGANGYEPRTAAQMSSLLRCARWSKEDASLIQAWWNRSSSRRTPHFMMCYRTANTKYYSESRQAKVSTT